MPVFRYRSRLSHPPDEVFRWHERPGAFERLSPPWVDVEVVEREGGIRDGGRVVLRVRKGPVDVRWELRHRDYEENRRFRDEQVDGPLKRWLHTHRFEPTDDGGTALVDEVEWDPPMGAMADLFAGSKVERELTRLFAFRHRRLANDLALHARFRDRPRRTVAISGSTGLIGGHLSTFLTAGGHRVVPLVRHREQARDGAIFWDWRAGEIDREALEGTDAVVHLAGEPLVGFRWTSDKKREIWDSRVKGTELIARTMAGLHGGPSTLVNASGIDYYGGRGDEILTEESPAGRGFLADLCRAWEDATSRADRSGVRVVRIRTGFVLTPEGGALGTMLLPFRVGLGGRIGNGRQYVPWIDLDDEIGIIHHALMDEGVRGPLNLTAPHPVPNATFSDALGRVLGRPTLVPVPKLAVKALFGEMGDELLLNGQRARPEAIVAAGYEHLFQGLEESLRHQLGRPVDGAAGPGEVEVE